MFSHSRLLDVLALNLEGSLAITSSNLCACGVGASAPNGTGFTLVFTIGGLNVILGGDLDF